MQNIFIFTLCKVFCLFAWLQFNIASSNIPSHFKKDSFKFNFLNILNFWTDSDDSNAEDGPSEADSLKGPLQEADEKSRLVWCSELWACGYWNIQGPFRIARQNCPVFQWVFTHKRLCQVSFHAMNLKMYI